MIVQAVAIRLLAWSLAAIASLASGAAFAVPFVPDNDDAVVERAGIEVAVDPDSLPYVEGATIDFVDALMGGGFTVRNPRVESGGCACGRR